MRCIGLARQRGCRGGSCATGCGAVLGRQLAAVLPDRHIVFRHACVAAPNLIACGRRPSAIAVAGCWRYTAGIAFLGWSPTLPGASVLGGDPVTDDRLCISDDGLD